MDRELFTRKSLFGSFVIGVAVVCLSFATVYWSGIYRSNQASVPFQNDVRWGYGKSEITSTKGPPDEVIRADKESVSTVELIYKNQFYLGHRGILVYVTESDRSLKKILFKVRYDKERECLRIFSDLEERITTSLKSVEPERSSYNRLKGVPLCNAILLGKASKITYWNPENRNATISLYMGKRSNQNVVVIVEKKSREGLGEIVYGALRSLLETLRFMSS